MILLKKYVVIVVQQLLNIRSTTCLCARAHAELCAAENFLFSVAPLALRLAPPIS